MNTNYYGAAEPQPDFDTKAPRHQVTKKNSEHEEGVARRARRKRSADFADCADFL